MFRDRLVLICAAAGLLVPSSAFGQQATLPGVDGFDQPCAADTLSGRDQINHFIPDEVPAAKRSKLRGVVARSVLWRSGETLKVCFRSGSPKARARVAQFGGEWAKYANLKFDFGEAPGYRACQGDEAIKVDFMNTGPKVGYWSTLGTLSLKVDHSMNFSFLGDDDLPRDRAGRQMPEAEARRIILHEFGHAIGLLHEHQSPASGCDAEYYVEAVVAYGALRGWPPERSIHNMMQRKGPEFNATEVDRKSIMHYALPPWLFKAGEKSACFVAPNFEISEGDKAFVASIYPKAPAIAMRGAKPPLAAAAEKVLDEYRKSLQEAGVDKGKLERLVKDLKDTVSR